MLRFASKKRHLAAALIVAGLVALAGCGRSKPNQQAGKQLFTQRCGSCHILANAGTKGTTGPNLDAAFQQPLQAGIKRSTIRGVVREQIALPQGNVMPANLVKGKDADAVASYVADTIGKKGVAVAGPSGTAKANSKDQVEIPANPNGQLQFQVKDAIAKPGKVTLLSKNASSVPHDIALKGGPIGPIVSGGKTSSITVDLKPGKYTFYCSVPGHEQAGMKGTLSVK